MAQRITLSDHTAWVSVALVVVAGFAAMLLLLSGVVPPSNEILDSGRLGSRGNPIDVSVLNPIRPSLD